MVDYYCQKEITRNLKCCIIDDIMMHMRLSCCLHCGLAVSYNELALAALGYLVWLLLGMVSIQQLFVGTSHVDGFLDCIVTVCNPGRKPHRLTISALKNNDSLDKGYM